MLINFLKNIGSIIGVDSTNSASVKQNTYSKNYFEKNTQEDDLCDIAFASAEENNGDSLIAKILNAISNFFNISTDSTAQTKDISGQPDVKVKVPTSSKNLLVDIRKLGIDTNELPSEATKLIYTVYKTMGSESSSVKNSRTREGERQYFETFDKDGNKNAGYEIIRGYNGDIKIQTFTFNKNGKLVRGQGVIINSNKTVETYSLAYDSEGNERRVNKKTLSL